MFRGVRRVHLASVDSTNAYARRTLCDWDVGLVHVVTSSEQTEGRGRLSRTWTSSADDITMTIAFQLPASAVASAYQLSPLLAISTCRAVSTAACLPLGIKWPNDLIAGGARKVGGILCELETSGGGVGGSGGSGGGGGTSAAAVAASAMWAVLGVGVNVNSTPEALAVARPVWPLSTLRAEAAGRQIDSPALTDAMVAAFVDVLEPFLLHGFAPYLDEYNRLSVLTGRRIRFSQQANAPPRSGAVAGIRGDGALLVKLDGEEAEAALMSGEVSGVVLDDGSIVGHT